MGPPDPYWARLGQPEPSKGDQVTRYHFFLPQRDILKSRSAAGENLLKVLKLFTTILYTQSGIMQSCLSPLSVIFVSSVIFPRMYEGRLLDFIFLSSIFFPWIIHEIKTFFAIFLSSQVKNRFFKKKFLPGFVCVLKMPIRLVHWARHYPCLCLTKTCDSQQKCSSS